MTILNNLSFLTTPVILEVRNSTSKFLIQPVSCIFSGSGRIAVHTETAKDEEDVTKYQSLDIGTRTNKIKMASFSVEFTKDFF